MGYMYLGLAPDMHVSPGVFTCVYRYHTVPGHQGAYLPTKVLGVFFVGAVVQWRLPCLVDATLSGHQI